jgi:AraC family transcriptional regulator
METAVRPRTRVLISDTPAGAVRPFSDDAEVICSSASAPWEEAITAEFDHVPPTEMNDCYTRQHTVVIHLGKRNITIEQLVAPGTYEPITVRRGAVKFDPQGSLTGVRQPAAQDILFLLPSELTFQKALAEVDAPEGLEFIRTGVMYDAHIVQIGLALIEEVESGFSSGRLYGESLALALASRLISRFSSKRVRYRTYESGLSRWRLRRTLDYIDENLGGDLTLSNLAAAAKLNDFYFSRLFKQSMGMTPHRYVVARRIDRARQLLADPRLSLAEISWRLGFASQAHFTTVFRKATGLTPLQFRNGVRP